jgi:hypothetical protein
MKRKLLPVPRPDHPGPLDLIEQLAHGSSDIRVGAFDRLVRGR